MIATFILLPSQASYHRARGSLLRSVNSGLLGTAYCERTFGSGLVAKKVDGRHIHGGELLHLIKAYVTTFHEATAFPEAKTLLAATSEANDRMAKDAALKSYKEEMDHECKKGYKGISASLDFTCSDLSAIVRPWMIVAVVPHH